MPAPYNRRDWQQKTDRAVNRMSRGNRQGGFSGARPVVGNPVAAQPAHDPFGAAYARDSWIDTFTITDNTRTAFTLSFEAAENSWNVSCSWDMVNGDEYSIDGRAMTVVNPAVAFIGASATYPKTLQVQYDYLTGIAAEPTRTMFRSGCTTTAAWTSASVNSIVAGRNGNCFQFTTTPQHATEGVAPSVGVVVGFAFNPTSLSGIGGGEFVGFYGDAATVNHVFGSLDNGTGTVRWSTGIVNLLNSTGLVTTGWHYYEVAVVIDDTVGSITVYKDGTLHSSVSGVDTRNAGIDGLVDSVRFQAHGNTTKMDDVYIAVGTAPLGDPGAVTEP